MTRAWREHLISILYTHEFSLPAPRTWLKEDSIVDLYIPRVAYRFYPIRPSKLTARYQGCSLADVVERAKGESHAGGRGGMLSRC